MTFEPFTSRSAHIAALPAANIDTDVIMPKVFLKGVDRKGLDVGVFHDLRYESEGNPRADFVLNKPPWNRAEFLVTGENFGCGSSREHAVWGLMQWGIRAIFAESFAGIFFDNCARNGLLAVSLKPHEIADLTDIADAGDLICVDLEAQTITTPRGNIRFEISDRQKYMLLNGIDAIGMTLSWRKEIAAFQDDYLARNFWLAARTDGKRK